VKGWATVRVAPSSGKLEGGREKPSEVKTRKKGGWASSRTPVRWKEGPSIRKAIEAKDEENEGDTLNLKLGKGGSRGVKYFGRMPVGKGEDYWG